MKKLVVFFLSVALLFSSGCAGLKNLGGKEGLKEEASSAAQGAAGLARRTDTLRVHFLDVGQGDSILVQFPNGRNMLVDAGKNDSASTVISYLKKNRVKKIDYLVGTHPHEDHIGSLDAVIKSFEIGEIFMPKAVTGTESFRDVLAAVKNKGLQIKTAKAGVSILEDGNLFAKIIAPCGPEYEGLNNYSAVIKVEYGDVAFLLAGDAEELSEKEILAGGADVKAQVLKVGHHGSHSSTSTEFLKAVAPKYAVISAGAGNDYHHPHQVTLDKLSKAGVTVLRTDEKGTIVFGTDGKDLAFATTK
ncbi:predicted hydrolase [Pelotomaculum thermopropionicum SI]|uniref:Predicted hydrolase n=1 Tax=Pelotomaculum thermopropionicum (strain DSM 13744 / JCM 10971 / SI) TaxID=370438 RepID=A5D4S5_PELTS|nr:predicted hydrolase [Pelotomaculum thermopropionicum SI]